MLHNNSNVAGATVVPLKLNASRSFFCLDKDVMHPTQVSRKEEGEEKNKEAVTVSDNNVRTSHHAGEGSRICPL